MSKELITFSSKTVYNKQKETSIQIMISFEFSEKINKN